MSLKRSLIAVVFFCALLAVFALCAISAGVWYVWPVHVESTEFSFPGAAQDLAFSKDSKYLIAASQSYSKWENKEWQSEIRVWSVETKEEVICQRFASFIQSFSLSPDGTKLVVSSQGWPILGGPAEITLLEFPSLKALKRMEVGQMVSRVMFSPDGKKVAFAQNDTREPRHEWQIWILDAETFQKATSIPNIFLPSFDVTPDSDAIICAHYLRVAPGSQLDSVLDLYEIQTGKLKKRFEPFHGRTNSWEHVGNKLLLHDSCYEFESPETLVAKKREEFTGCHLSSHSPDGRWVILPENTRVHSKLDRCKLHLRNLERGWKQDVYQENRRITATAFSPDSKYFAAGTSATRKVLPDEAPPPATGRVILFKTPE